MPRRAQVGAPSKMGPLDSTAPASPGSPPPQSVVIKDAGGLFTNNDAADIPPGTAREQVNVCAEMPGAVRVRMGYVRVLFRD
jgi:hypothetical protein